MAEPFGLMTRVGPGNHVLDGVEIPSWEGATCGGTGGPLLGMGRGRSAVNTAKKRLNRSRCLLGFGLGWDE